MQDLRQIILLDILNKKLNNEDEMHETVVLPQTDASSTKYHQSLHKSAFGPNAKSRVTIQLPIKYKTKM